MAVEYGIQASAYVLYDGTNSSEVLTAVEAVWGGDAFIVSEDENGLKVNSGQEVNDPITVHEGERLGAFTWTIVSASDWADKYAKA